MPLPQNTQLEHVPEPVKPNMVHSFRFDYQTLLVWSILKFSRNHPHSGIYAWRLDGEHRTLYSPSLELTEFGNECA